jgi:hypothetical protein
MLLIEGQMLAKGLITFIMISQSLESPTPPKWEVRAPRKLFSILKQQGRIQLNIRQQVKS